MSFAAPVRDQRLVLDQVVRIDQLAATERFADATSETVDAVLEGAAQFATGEFAPLDRIGDTVGSKWADGSVTTPPGFKDAYAAFVEGGWMTLAAPVEAGGQGLPLALSAALMEDLNAANIGFALCPMLSMGAIEALEAHGSDRQKADYLPKIVSGEWPATMNLTEPQAGSDVGALKTKAEPNGDGSRAPRFTSPMASTTWPRTSSISSSLGPRGHPRGPRGFRCSSSPRYSPMGLATTCAARRSSISLASTPRRRA